MSLHDDIHRNAEQEIYDSTKKLLIYLKTISPDPSYDLQHNLLCFAKSMGWEIIDDEQIGDIIK